MTKKLMVLAAAVGAAATVFGAGVASADQNYNGMKYSEALSKIKAAGATAKVSARVGDQLNEGDCLVKSYTKSALPARGFTMKGPSSIVLVALDCNGGVASPGKPGLSAASPEGRKAVELKKKMEWLATPDGQVYCVKAVKDHPDWGLTCPPPAAPA
jgi:hypothetical protein